MGASTSSPTQRFSLNDLRFRRPHTPGVEYEISPYKVSPLIVEMKKKNQWKSRFNALKDTDKLVTDYLMRFLINLNCSHFFLRLLVLQCNVGVRTEALLIRFKTVLPLQPLVIEFTAKWCGPCKSLEAKLEELAAKYTDVEFVKIDVDVLKSVWKEYNLHALPTVVFMKRGQEVDRVVGLKLDEIEGKLHKYAYSF
ncbi:hypothetical protein YC2023_079132 [Brassica napus]